MQQTRREILDEFLDFLTEKGDSNARNKAERALNRALLTIWLERAWSQFQGDPHLFSTVAGTRSYALPSHFGRMSGKDGQIRNITNGGWITPREREDLEIEMPTFGTSLEAQGTPSKYVLDGVVGVHTQPSSAGEACEVVSSSGSDVTVRAFVEGVNDSDQYTRAQVTLTGQTAVAIGTWKRIERFGKSLPEGLDPATELTTSVGSVTLRTVTDATELQTLLSDESAVEHVQLTLVPTPNGVYQISVPFLRALRRVYQDADPMPRFWGNAIFEELCVQWQVNRGKFSSEAQVPRPQLNKLMAFDQAGRVPSLKRRVPFTGGYGGAR
jgi:hypothetical protein